MAHAGQFCLIFSLLLSGYAMLADIRGGWKQDFNWIKNGRNAFLGCFFFLSIAIDILFVQLISCDFANGYVAEHTSRDLPLAYRLSALWAGQAGSLLLWIWLQMGMLCIAFFSLNSDRINFNSNARIISNLVTLFFLFVLVFDKNPFAVLPAAPADGAGLNPLLQHPAMVLHPPVLFAGYAALAVPFAWAFARLKSSVQSDVQDVKSARYWTLAGWTFLTAGIVLGSWWAYEELGWGGYWGWDPVENSSLLPWLTATGLVHSLRISKSNKSLWPEILSLLTYSLCIFGTFLTRYGLVSSVHAFADPGLGMLFLVLLLFIWVAAGALIVKHYLANDFDSVSSIPQVFAWNNWLMLFLALVIFVGTLFPFLSRLVSEREITLNADYFTKITSPAAFVLVVFIGLCPCLWRRGFKESGRLVLSVIVIASCIGIWVLLKRTALAFLIVCGFTILNLIWDTLSSVKTRQIRIRTFAAWLVHLGVAVVFIGIAGSGGYDIERQYSMVPGQREKAGEYEIAYESLGAEHEENVTKMWAQCSIYRQGQVVANLRPARAVYTTSENVFSEVDIYRKLGSDVYLALMNADVETRQINLHVMIKPLINWIWIGSCFLILGSTLVLFDLVARKRDQA